MNACTVRLAGWLFHVDEDGLLLRRQSDDVCEMHGDLDAVPHKQWVVDPSSVRGWLFRAYDADDESVVDQIMTELELAE